MPIVLLLLALGAFLYWTFGSKVRTAVATAEKAMGEVINKVAPLIQKVTRAGDTVTAQATDGTSFSVEDPEKWLGDGTALLGLPKNEALVHATTLAEAVGPNAFLDEGDKPNA